MRAKIGKVLGVAGWFVALAIFIYGQVTGYIDTNPIPDVPVVEQAE